MVSKKPTANLKGGLAFCHFWAKANVLQAKLQGRYEWLQNRPPQPNFSTPYGPAERLRSDPPTYLPT